MTGSPVASTDGDGNGESPDAAAAAVNGPALLPTDGKGGAEVHLSQIEPVLAVSLVSGDFYVS